MSRRTVVAAVGVFVVALVIAATVYLGNLQAGEPAAAKATPISPKAGPALPAAEPVKQLEKRIASLEERIAALEKRDSLFLSPAVGPNLRWAPQPLAPRGENDGFPPARILLIGHKAAVEHGQP